MRHTVEQRAEAERLRARVAPRIAEMSDPAAVHALLDREVRATLEAAANAILAVEDEESSEPRAVARPSKTLAEARAQVARLGARWIDLRERVLQRCPQPPGSSCTQSSGGLTTTG